MSSGIPHLASLDPSKFIEVIDNIHQFIVTEKLDGSNLTFGFTAYGQFYTSREAKNGDKVFSECAYELKGANNGFRSAHVALSSVQDVLRDIVGCGNAIEIEVLYGEQPNTIKYGKNYIVFLRAVVGVSSNIPEQDVIDRLRRTFDGVIITARDVNKVVVKDEEWLDIETSNEEWVFKSVTPIHSPDLTYIGSMWDALQLADWLTEIDPDLNMPHKDVLNINLNKVPVKDREWVRNIRRNAKDLSQQFKDNIVNVIVDLVLRTTKPKLQTIDLNQYDIAGIEGIVLLNPTTLEQYKVVDVNTFTLANSFFHTIHNQIKNTFNKEHTFNAKIVEQGDLYGNMLLDLAAILETDLSKYTKIKSHFKQFIGSSIDDTVRNFILSLSANEQELRLKIPPIVDTHIKLLGNAFNKYKLDWRQYSCTLPNGQVIRFSDHIHSRNIMRFLEVQNEMLLLSVQLQEASTLADMIKAIYHKQLVELHDA